MSAYNRLRAKARCPNCGQTSDQVIQFGFGDAWLHEYSLGDPLRWGGNDIGRPGLRKVVVAGAGEECPVCHSRGEEFSVIVEQDVLIGIDDSPGEPLLGPDGELYVIVDE